MTSLPDDSTSLNGLRSDGLPDMVWCSEIPPGDYSLSSDEGVSSLGHEQQIFTMKHPFRLAKYPITQAQFHVFMQDDRVDKVMPDYIVALESPEKSRGSVWWSDTFVFARWLDQHYHAARLLGTGWQIDIPSEIEWELTARYPDGKSRWPTKGQKWTPEIGDLQEINPDTGMHIVSGFFREWCLLRNWHSRDGLAAEVDAILQDRKSWTRLTNYMVRRGIRHMFRTTLAPTWDYNIGMRVVCRQPSTLDAPLRRVRRD